MDYTQMLEEAKKAFGGKCMACPVCDGRACRNRVPGPGAKGTGTVAARNYAAWQEVLINMDNLSDVREPDTSAELFGETFSLPVFAGPVGAVALHYGNKYDDLAYNNILVPACAEAGIAAFTGDGVVPYVFASAAKAIGEAGGRGIPTIKPWDRETVFSKLDAAKASGARIFAMDVDAAGLPFLKGQGGAAGCKTVEEMREIIRYAGVPFIIKGIMTPAAAEKAVLAGAAGIVVSNHGGRVLDGVPATADVLNEIAAAVAGRLTILVDGGIRSGVDVFRALALGADGCLIARPYVTAVYGGGPEGVRLLTEKLKAELQDTMLMCGAHSIDEISADMIY